MKAPIAKPVAAPPHCPPIFFFLMFFFFFLDVDERERERVMLDEGVTSEAQLYAPLDEAELDDDGDEGAHSRNDGGGSAAETPIGVRCVYPLCFSFNPRRTIGNARRYTNVEKKCRPGGRDEDDECGDEDDGDGGVVQKVSMLTDGAFLACTIGDTPVSLRIGEAKIDRARPEGQCDAGGDSTACFGEAIAEARLGRQGGDECDGNVHDTGVA